MRPLQSNPKSTGQSLLRWKEWAKKVFPNAASDEDSGRLVLWGSDFQTCHRVCRDDPVASWQAHEEKLSSKASGSK